MVTTTKLRSSEKSRTHKPHDPPHLTQDAPGDLSSRPEPAMIHESRAPEDQAEQSAASMLDPHWEGRYGWLTQRDKIAGIILSLGMLKPGCEFQVPATIFVRSSR